MVEPRSIAGDIQVSDSLDGVILTPRDTRDVHDLRKIIKTTLPGVTIHRSALGLAVAGFQAVPLLEGEGLEGLRWTETARLFLENRRRVKRDHPRILAEVSAILSGDRAGVRSRRYLENMEGLEVLDDHQIINVAAMTLTGSFGLCVFDEQGTGKTVTLIYAFDRLIARDEADLLLIVAPKSMVGEWPQDFQRFKGDFYRVQVVAGNRNLKRRALRSGADVFVTNFETAVSMEGELRALLRRYRGRVVLTVDESFFIKNRDARRTQALRRLREWCGKAFVLCGTPAPNSPQDLIEQFNLVDFGLTFEGVELPDDREQVRLVVQRAVDERGLFVRHLKQQVLPDLPQKRFTRLLLSLQPEQGRLYETVLYNLIRDIKATDEETFRNRLTSFLARRSALLQICSHPASVVEEYQEVPAKLLALDSLLEQLICGMGEKVVVWSFFTRTIDEIVARYARHGVVRYDGTVADVSERRAAVKKFQEDGDTMVFVGNPAAAGAGLTLHRARIAIYESMSNQAAHYLQSLDRVHRRGQRQAVEYIVLLCEGTLEEEEYARLLMKERAAHELLGDRQENHITRDSFLSEVLQLQERLGQAGANVAFRTETM
jgi:SNF2 family DNA or RNA helicase